MNAANYSIVIVPLSEDDGGGYAAHVPDLPGCMSDGDTREEAATNAHDAIECWLDAARDSGRHIPEPGEAVRKLRERDQAMLNALRAALDYMDHADGRLAVLEGKIDALTTIMNVTELSVATITVGVSASKIAAPCH